MTGEYRLLPIKSTVFDVQEVIGSGSFSQVYKAQFKETGELVALKVYRTRIKDETYYSHAATEMAFLRFLNHPHIIKFICAEIKPEHMFMAIELSQRTLHDLIEDTEKLVEEKVKKIMQQLMSAVCYLHSINIFHGDIKPENIMVFGIEDHLTIKLCDFGLSDIIITPEASRKKLGSFYYMAPEILLGFPYDFTADIFSSGIVMYEMLFGKRPFGKKVNKDIYLGHLKKRVAIEIPMDKKISDDCLNFLKKLLPYDKKDRLVGQDVANHPFLKIKYTPCVQNHYMKACECLVKGIELVNALDFGSGYLEVKEAILHLKIYLNTIKGDNTQFQYISNKYNDYVAYAALIEKKLKSNISKGLVDAGKLLQSERLRCLLKSTPTMLAAYDICSLGEMYYMQRDIPHALTSLTDGLNQLFPMTLSEPEGLRKQLLASKIDHWINIVETINRLNEPKQH